MALPWRWRPSFQIRWKNGVAAIGAQPTLYASAESHHSLDKSAGLLGIGRRALRRIAVNEAAQLDPKKLDQAIDEDRAAGRKPFCVVATAGTTNSGAVDDLVSISEICKRHGLWLHVDGAYGAAVIFSYQHRNLVRGIELADSLTIDPHKWLAMPFAAGVILTSHPAILERAFSVAAPYMPKAAGAHLPDNSRISTQWTRRMNSLKLWLTLRVHGRKAYEELIDRQLQLAKSFVRWVEASADFGLAAPQTLPIVTFRLKCGGTYRTTAIDRSRRYRRSSNARRPALDFRNHRQRSECAEDDGYQLLDRGAAFGRASNRITGCGWQIDTAGKNKGVNHQGHQGTLKEAFETLEVRRWEESDNALGLMRASGLSFSAVRVKYRQRYRSVPSASWTLGRWRFAFLPQRIPLIGLTLPGSKFYFAVCSAHFQAVATISSSERLAFQLSSFSALLGSATNSGGSPGRAGAMRLGTSLPVTVLMVERTSRTEAPRPVPRLRATEAPPFKILQSLHVRLRQIVYMNVIANTGAIWA